jgi:2-polyprenyl-3-methyl-5-hydroxy-6-metoxy-1,4-benzoquinol methylase
MQDDRAERDAFAERLFRSALGYFDLLSIRLGQRLGLYEVLAEGPVTSQELASRAGIAERYAREWLEQQSTVGTLRADVETEDPTFSFPAGHAEVLLDGDSLSYMGASVWQLLTIPNAFENVVEAFRSGGGVSYEAYGRDNVQGQGLGNRPVFLTTLPNEWLPNIPPIHERLTAEPPARLVDVGCGTGWSSIAMAKTYPQVTVDGFDPDEVSIELGRKNAAVEGVADRVRFHRADAAEVTTTGPFDVATAFECIHDMARPVEVLGAVRRTLADEGSMLIVDERTRARFTGEPDELEAYFYGWSIFDCLPTGMYEQPSAGTGTVMRPSVLEGYAREAGFTRFQTLPIDHDTFRLYLLRP